MVVKEYCLIPKSKLDKHEYFKTPSPPHPSPPQRIEKPDERVLKEAEYDTSVDDSLKMALRPSDYEYGKGILSFLRKKPLVKWDREGQFTYPVRDINIVEAIRYWVTKNSTFDPNKIGDLRLLVRVGGLPESFIKNSRAKSKLFSKGGQKTIKKKKKINWIPY